jgi:probable rRNA maturation factor
VSIEIANESGAAVDSDMVLAVARYVLDEMGVNPLAELSILLVDIDYMTELNHRWMGNDGPTDVLAFPMEESSVDHGPSESVGEPALLGDIVLCPEVAAKQAASAGHGADDELHLLAVHGVLHLLGYDHAEPDEEREMFTLQARLLGGWQTSVGRPVVGAPPVPDGSTRRPTPDNGAGHLPQGS